MVDSFQCDSYVSTETGQLHAILHRWLIGLAFVPMLHAFGHHSPAPFDMTREVVFEGTVSELEWKNPHILLMLDTRATGSASPVLQEIEASALSQVRTWGLLREAIAPGERVVVRAWPNRRGERATALGIDVRTRDGRVYPLNLQSAGFIRRSGTSPATGLAGRWVPTIESWNQALRRWRSDDFPFTEAGRTTHAELVRNLAEQGTFEEEICSAEHPAGVAPSLLGRSIGRWEGETLVIDTVGIAPHPVGSFFVASTASTHFVERLSLTADRRRLEYSFTIEDPAHFTQPVSFAAIWDHRPDLEPSSAEFCDPDNARRSLVE